MHDWVRAVELVGSERADAMQAGVCELLVECWSDVKRVAFAQLARRRLDAAEIAALFRMARTRTSPVSPDTGLVKDNR